ncbi:hypothetical protein JKP88DRAFT_222392, partial [Tribonema minus]
MVQEMQAQAPTEDHSTDSDRRRADLPDEVVAALTALRVSDRRPAAAATAPAIQPEAPGPIRRLLLLRSGLDVPSTQIALVLRALEASPQLLVKRGLLPQQALHQARQECRLTPIPPLRRQQRFRRLPGDGAATVDLRSQLARGTARRWTAEDL